MEKTITSVLAKLKDSESSTSVLFGAIVVVVAGLLVFNFVSSNRVATLSPEGETIEAAQPGTPNENGYVSPTALPTKHVVKQGEHLWGVAEMYYGSGYNYVDLLTANSLSEKSGLKVGQELTIPQVAARKATVEAVIVAAISGESYQVVKGDSLWQIAVRAYGDGYKWTSLWNANKDMIQNPNVIAAGMTLKIVR